MSLATGGGHLALRPVDPHDARTGAHVHPLVGEDAGVECQVFDGLAAEVPRETHAVIRLVPLVAEHRDRPAPLGVAGGQALHEAVRDHSRTDHDDRTG